MPRPANLSMELLRTFILLVRNEGDATNTTRELKINQPSMSKRLKYLQHAGRVLQQPWLYLEGKTWKLTEEGKKVHAAVKEIVDRYEQLLNFDAGSKASRSELRFACGQEAASGLVLDAVQLFRRQHPAARLRISTLRVSARIEGVANGSLDLAVVTQDSAAIQRIARRKVYVETIASEPLALVCLEDSPWGQRLRKFARTRTPPEAFSGVPLILPAPNTGVRKGLDRVLRGQDLLGELEVIGEMSGWPAILAYARAGLGVGLVSTAAVPEPGPLMVRCLDPEVFRPTENKLICRFAHGSPDERDLSPEGRAFAEALRDAARKRRK